MNKKYLRETLNIITKIILYRENTKYTNYDRQSKAIDAVKNYVYENKIDYSELQSKQESNVIITFTATKEAVRLAKKQ